MKYKKLILVIILAFSISLKSQTGPWQLTSYPTIAGGWALCALGNTIYAGGNNGIYYSTDYGQSWVNTFSLSTMSLISYSNNTLFAGGSSTGNGAICTSTNGGLTWTDITPYIFPFNSGWNLAALLVNGSYLYASAFNGGSVYRCPLSNLSPYNWSTFNTGLPTSPDIYDLEFNGTNIIATGNFGVWMTSTSVASWSNTSNGITNTASMRDIAVENTTLFVGTAGTPQIHRSTNAGANWNPISNSTFSVNSEVWSITTKSNNIYVGTDQNGVIYSNDYGNSWTEYNLGFKDSNGNWLCSNMRVYSFLFMADTLFVGTSCGIWKSWGCSYPLNNTAAPNLTICNNHSTQLNVSGVGNINWYTSPTSTVSIATGSIYTTPILQTNTIYYVGNDICNDRDTINVIVKPNPTVTVNSSDNILCSGQSATLNAMGALNYIWNTSNIGSTIIVTPSITTTYSVLGTAANGCTVQQTYIQNVSTCAGIIKYDKLALITVYPIPSSDLLNIKITDQNKFKLYIIDHLGREIMKQEDANIIDISKLSNGVYFINIKFDNNPDSYFRFIKN